MEAPQHPTPARPTLPDSHDWLPTGMRLPDYVVEVVNYLRHRGLAADDDDAARTFVTLLMLGLRCDSGRMSVSRAARMLYVSRRGLGRRCLKAGVPPPSHILAFGRVLYAARILQSTKSTVFRVAEEAGWADPFGLSNTMYRLTGIRPTEVRDRGLFYVAEAWLQRELTEGNARLMQPKPPRCPSCGRAILPNEETGPR